MIENQSDNINKEENDVSNQDIVPEDISSNEGQSIAMLEKGQCIGEMSLLDQQPRSAGAIAMEDSVLLKIDQESFYELMASKPEIMREIMKRLTQRVRDINKKFTESRQSSG